MGRSGLTVQVKGTETASIRRNCLNNAKYRKRLKVCLEKATITLTINAFEHEKELDLIDKFLLDLF